LITGLAGRKEEGGRRTIRNKEDALPLNIKDADTHALARELAAATGETITKAVRVAIRERLEKVRTRRAARRRLADRLDEIAKHCSALPVLRARPIDEILGYDERGMPA
jgi:antitoxin VapB